jgi:hypothetical protein
MGKRRAGGGGGGGGGGMAEEKKGDTLYVRSIKTLRKPASRGRRAAGEVDMFISPRNLLGLHYGRAGEDGRETGEPSSSGWYLDAARRVFRGDSLRSPAHPRGECRRGLRAD